MSVIPSLHNGTPKPLLSEVQRPTKYPVFIYGITYYTQSIANCLCIASRPVFTTTQRNLAERSFSTMAESTGAHMHIAQDEASILAETNRKKQQAQQPRQLLSCTKCRERKVKVSHIHRFALQIAI